MDEEVPRLSLQDLVVTSWGSREEDHKRSLGDGWPLAEDYVALHTEAMRKISKAAGSSPSQSDQATILLGCHGLNLFIETMGLLVRGLFDVSAQLLRPLMDTQSLVYACARGEDLASRYLEEEGKPLKAAEARKLFVAHVRSEDDALANDLDRILSDDADAANDLAHVKRLHGDKLSMVEAGKVTPTAWGMTDPGEAVRQSQAAISQEHGLLVSLKAFRTEVVGQRWIKELDGMDTRLVKHMKLDRTS
ncbi:MAG: hypothetical protein IIC91_13635 [Chloroflexi bacterium]|nr:hypothetical protein [Chloroflexota bacterium]